MSVTIPVGAMLLQSPHTSTALVGIVGVAWEDRLYSVSFNDLLKNAELVEAASQSRGDRESCGDCLRLEQRLRSASELYVSLIVQHDQMMREGKPDASTIDNAIKNCRRRRNAAGRLLLDHRINHEALSRPKTRTAGQL
jgi:hypothetical protein